MAKIDAYTVGETAAYFQKREHKAAAGLPFVKIGRSEDYPGGAVFRDRESAQQFIDANHYPYSVWGLTLPHGWEQDVDETAEADEGFCRLLHDAELVPL